MTSALACVRVCVPLVVTGILLNCFRLLQQGGAADARDCA